MSITVQSRAWTEDRIRGKCKRLGEENLSKDQGALNLRS